MKASNISLLKLSAVSSRHFLRRSAQLEKRCFVTILNPSAPKVKRLQRSPGFEAQTFESEKISILRKALEEANLEQSSVESPTRYEGVPSIKDTVSTDVEDVKKVTGQDSAVEKEIIENLLKPKEDEPITLEEAQITPKETPSSPVESTQEENDTQSVKVELDKFDSDPDMNSSINQEKKKKLTKKGKKSTNATATISTDGTEEEDSSSSDSDSSSSSSSSSSDSGSEVENDEKVLRSRRLTQDMFLDLAKLSHVKPHKPMIKFRKGKGALVKSDQVKREAESDINIQESSPTVLEWWEKPAKYYPEALDESEIEQINSGGASQLYQ